MFHIDMEKCTECGQCLDECQLGGIKLDGDGEAINQDLCVRCGWCHDTCPFDAIEMRPDVKEQRVAINLENIWRILRAFDNDEYRQTLLARVTKFYELQLQTTQDTVDRLHALKGVSPKEIEGYLETLVQKDTED